MNKKLLLIPACLLIFRSMLFAQSMELEQGKVAVLLGEEWDLQSCLADYKKGDTYPDIKEIALGGELKASEFAILRRCENLEVLDFNSLAMMMMPAGSIEGNAIPAMALSVEASGGVEGLSKLKTLSLPSTLESIGTAAFGGSPSLSYINWGELTALKSIAMDAFSYSALTSVEIPASVTSLDANAFVGSLKLATLSVAAGNTAYESQDNLIYSKSTQQVLMNAPGNALTKVTIKEGTKSIGDMLFYNNKTIEEFVLPASLRTIGNRAFEGMGNLKRINLPEGIETIGYSAFQQTALEEVTIPSTVKHLSLGLFYRCENLTSVKLHAGIEHIEGKVFAECPALASIDLSTLANLTGFEDQVFLNSKAITDIDLSASKITAIGESSFKNLAALSRVKLPATVKRIRNSAFEGCETLNLSELPAALDSIGKDAFKNNKALSRIALGGKVSYIGPGAFAGCSGVTEIEVADDNQNFVAAEGLLVSGDGTTIIYATLTADVATLIEDFGLAIVTLPDYVFAGNKTMRTISFGVSLESIGKGVFMGCENLEQIDLSAATNLTAIGDSAFALLSNLKEMKFPADNASTKLKLGVAMFRNCSVLETVTLPAQVTGFTMNMFENCVSLQSVNLSKCVPSYIPSMFANCTALKSVTFNEEKVSSFDNDLFKGCSSLKSFMIPKKVADVNGKMFAHSGITAFENNPASTALTVVDGVVFNAAGTTLMAFPAAKAGEYVVPEGTTKIGNNAFVGNSVVTKITLPKSIVAPTWGNVQQSFFGLSALSAYAVADDHSTLAVVNGALYKKDKTVLYAWPEAGNAEAAFAPELKSIYGYAFAENKSIRSLNITHVETIESSAFLNCVNLTSLTLPATLTKVAYNGFAGCTALNTLVCKAETAPTIFPSSFANKEMVVYVPEASVAHYQSAPNWMNYDVRPIAESALEQVENATPAVVTIQLQGSLLRVESVLEVAAIQLYDMSGRLINSVSGCNELEVPTAGIILVRIQCADGSTHSMKVVMRN